MLHTDFTHNFMITANPELPGTGTWNIPELYIPSGFVPKPNQGHLILKVEVRRKRQIWHVNAPENCEIWTTPDPNRILVSGMRLMYIAINNPKDIFEFDLFGSTVTPLQDREIILINDYFSVLALGAEGVKWQTDALFSDDMFIERIDGNKIFCVGLSLNDIEATSKVIIDVRNGEILERSEGQQTKIHPTKQNQFSTLRSWLKRK